MSSGWDGRDEVGQWWRWEIVGVGVGVGVVARDGDRLWGSSRESRLSNAYSLQLTAYSLQPTAFAMLWKIKAGNAARLG